jgi:hypothetical protein
MEQAPGLVEASIQHLPQGPGVIGLRNGPLLTAFGPRQGLLQPTPLRIPPAGGSSGPSFGAKLAGTQ